MRGSETPWADLNKILHGFIPDVITCANFGEHRLRALGLTGRQNLPFSIDFDRRPTVGVCDKGKD